MDVLSDGHGGGALATGSPSLANVAAELTVSNEGLEAAGGKLMKKY